MDTNEGGEVVTTTTETPTQAPSTPAAAPAMDGGVAVEVTQQPSAEPAAAAQPPGQERQTQRPSRVDRRNAELARRNRELEERLLRLEGAVSVVRPQAEAAPKGEEDPEPDPAKFPGGEYGREYWQAWNRWDRRQAAKEDAEKSNQRAASERQQAEWDEAGQRFQSIRRTAEETGYEDGADFLDALVQREDFDVVDDITDMENAAAVAQFLGSQQRNPKMEAWRQRILKSLDGGKTKRVRELTRLDDALTDHFRRKAAASAAPSNGAPPNSPAATPTKVPTPTPQANGRASTPGASDSGYDQLFRN